MNFLRQGFRKLSCHNINDRHTDNQTHKCDQNYIPRRFGDFMIMFVKGMVNFDLSSGKNMTVVSVVFTNKMVISIGGHGMLQIQQSCHDDRVRNQQGYDHLALVSETKHTTIMNSDVSVRNHIMAVGYRHNCHVVSVTSTNSNHSLFAPGPIHSLERKLQ